MSGPFGPQGKRLEKPSHDEEVERFTRAFGFEPEPEVQPEFIPPEAAWDDTNRKSPMAQYYKRHPEKRPAPKQLLKNMGPQIASDGTKAGAIVEKLLNQLQVLMESNAALQEKLTKLEARINPDPCVESHGKNFRSVDGKCLEVQPGMLDPTPVPVAAKATESATVNRIMNKSGGKFFRKDLRMDGPWEIIG
jgi:hypothetical protein